MQAVLRDTVPGRLLVGRVGIQEEAVGTLVLLDTLGRRVEQVDKQVVAVAEQTQLGRR